MNPWKAVLLFKRDISAIWFLDVPNLPRLFSDVSGG